MPLASLSTRQSGMVSRDLMYAALRRSSGLPLQTPLPMFYLCIYLYPMLCTARNSTENKTDKKPVMVRVNYQLDKFRIMGGMGLWACQWAIFLTVLINVERWAGPSQGRTLKWMRGMTRGPSGMCTHTCSLLLVANIKQSGGSSSSVHYFPASMLHGAVS